MTTREDVLYDARLSRRLLQRTYEVAGIGTYLIDLTQHTIFVSVEMAHLLRAGTEAFTLPLDDYRRRFYAAPDRQEWWGKADAAYAAETTMRVECFCLRGDGELIYVRSSSSVERDDLGQPVAVGIVQDITAERRAEQTLAASEALVRQFVKHTPAAVAMLDTELRYLLVSDRWLTDYHLEGQDMRGRSHYEVFPDIPESWKAIHRRVLAGGCERCDEAAFPRADGTLEWLQWEVRPWLTPGGEVGGVIMFTQVITDRKRADQRVRDSEARFRSLSDHSPVGIHIIQGGRLSYVNPSLESTFGYQPGELVGADPLVLIHPDHRARVADQLRRQIAREAAPAHVELKGMRKTGETIDIEVHGGPTELDGRTALVGNIMDVTARKRAEASLQESEDKFRRLSENSLAGTCVVQDNRVIYANAAMERIFGYRPGEMIGMDSSALIHPDDRNAVAEHVRRRLASEISEVHYEARAWTRTGQLIWYEVLGSSTIHDGRPAVFGNIIDITARKRAEEALRDSVERFRQITEAIDEVFWVLDPDTQRYLYVSPAFEKVWGVAPDGPALSPQSLLAAIHPDDRERVRVAVLSKQRTGDYDETYRITRPDGTLRWIHDRAFPLRDPRGEVYRIVGTASDITAHQNLESQLRQAQKMEAVGVLAGGVAHDFNNLLAVILSYSSMMLEDMDPRDPICADLQEIQSAGQRAEQLTRQLLAFSRRQVLQPRTVDLNEVVAGTEKLLRRMIGEDVALQTHLCSIGPHAFVDVGQIEQVLMNLAVNARDAMPQGGTLSIDVGRSELDVAGAAQVGVGPGTYVTLSVTDTGIGMDDATQTRIFEPFFTTKEAGKGTGLGLSTVFGIVHQSGGQIAVDSAPGKGARFRIWLPVAVSEAMPEAAVALDGDLHGTETILLVEDEEAVRKLARAILSRRGYRVLEAQTAGDAVVICERHPDPIDLVLTDVVMPLMSGEQLVERLRGVRAGLRVVYMSGYPDQGGASRAVLPESFVQKPFTPEALLRRIREVLTGAPRTRPATHGDELLRHRPKTSSAVNPAR